MSYHIVSIDSPKCSLTCRDGQLICRTDEGEKKLPLEDVASIIITSFSASIHSQLFLEAAKQGVALIICETFRPVSLVLPANRSTDTLLTRALLKLSPAHVNQLWRTTVDAKCLNQLSLAEYLSPKDAALAALRDAAQGRKAHKEAVCAKLFWQIYGRSQGVRCQTSGPVLLSSLFPPYMESRQSRACLLPKQSLALKEPFCLAVFVGKHAALPA